MYEKFLEKVKIGQIDDYFCDFMSKIEEMTESEKLEFKQEMHGQLGVNSFFDVFYLSYMIWMTKEVTYLNELCEMILSCDDFNYNQVFFLHGQIQSLTFYNEKLNTKEICALNWKIMEKAFLLCKKELKLNLSPIPESERNKDVAVVITEQFLEKGHGPTKTALDRCYVLQKKLGKRVILINTAELLPVAGYMPFVDVTIGNYIENRYMWPVEWRGEIFHYYQCKRTMPSGDGICNLISVIQMLKPSVVVAIGGDGLCVGFVNEMIPVLTLGLTQSTCSQTLTDYQVVDTNQIEYVNWLLKKINKKPDHVIEGKFTFSFKEQTDFITRADLGISEDAFVMAVVGARLDSEIDEEFLALLNSVLRDNMCVLVIGEFNSYEEKLVKWPGLRKHIINLGFCKDVLSRLELCDLYINPTRSGGGTSVLEAMSKGKPAVTVDYGDVAGIVGEKFSCANYEEMGRIIERYYTDLDFYNEQAEFARKLVAVYTDSEGEFTRIMGEYEKRMRHHDSIDLPEKNPKYLNILYIDYNMYGKDDIVRAFENLGHHVDITDIPVVCDEKNSMIQTELDDFISGRKYDIVFTSNYYPVVSDICNKYNIKYISWTYDSPLVNLYDKSITNKYNYAFTFDMDEYHRLKGKGVSTVYYMPLAVNAKRLDNIKITDRDRELFSCDVGMVASLYNEEHNLYDRMEPRLSEHTKGYLQGVMNVQKNLFGAFIMEDALCDKDIMNDMYKAMPYNVGKGSLINREYVYANYFLSRKVASMQRVEYIKAISAKYDMKVFSGGDLSGISTVKHMGTVDYMTDMNKVFKLSRINLNVTLPSIHTGIPLRIMDILGNGGFLLTNYQADMFEFFEPGVDFVYYTSLDEAMEMIEYYLSHEDERATIAENAKEKMRKYHTFENRLSDMLFIALNG